MVHFLHKTSFIYDEGLLSYNFGQDHPFRPERIKICMDQLLAKGIIGNSKNPIIKPRTATDEEALSFHTREYVRHVRSLSIAGSGMLDSGDTPAFQGCYDASLGIVGATLSAIEHVSSGTADHAVNFSGGLHHAHRGNASGFCIFNDCAIGIELLLKMHRKVAYIDIDAHHGDGVMYGFYNDPRVLSIDIHQDGSTLFPGTGNYFEAGSGAGEGYKVNLPVPPGTADDMLLGIGNDIVVPMLRKIKPGFILMQCSADGIKGDPLAKLFYSETGYVTFVKLVHDASHELCSGRIVLTGGGGYNAEAAAKCWANEFQQISCPSTTNPNYTLTTSNGAIAKRINELKAMICSKFDLG